MIAQSTTARTGIVGSAEVPSRINIPSDRLNRELEWVLKPRVSKAEQIPPAFAAALAATIWLLEVDSFRDLEERYMIEGAYKDKLPEHRAAISQLISNGEHLVLFVKRHGMIVTPAGFKVEDLMATLELLHTTFQCEHGERNSTETDKVIEGVFAQFDEKPQD
jgi:hypothetical protein